MPLRLAVFDVDGTLADSQHNIVAAMTDAFEAVGLPPPPADAVRGVIGLALDETLTRLAPGIDAPQTERLAEAYRESFFARRTRPDFHEPLFPGALDTLAHLERRGIVLALATGKSRRGAVAFLERHGLTSRFLSVRTADDGPGKPDPWMLTDTMARLGCEPAHTVMIGDTTYDMDMARRAGVTGIGVSWGSHDPDTLRTAGARAVATTFAEVTTLLDRDDLP